MFCNSCGREINDEAKFCNYCGAPVKASPAVQVQADLPVQQPAQNEKKSGGNRFLSIVISVVVFFAVRYAVGSLFNHSASSRTTTSSSSSAGLINVTQSSPLRTCLYGGLYKDGYLTYGSARIRLSGYQLMPGEGSEADYLISSDNTVLVSVNKTAESNISYDASNADGMLRSYTTDPDYTNVRMVDFRKYEVSGCPVIRYIVACTLDDTDEYIGELIVLPAKTTNEVMRFAVFTLQQTGYSPINQVFDSLSISSAYNLKPGDTGDMGVDQITAK